MNIKFALNKINGGKNMKYKKPKIKDADKALAAGNVMPYIFANFNSYGS